jgi:hypothetical protein
MEVTEKPCFGDFDILGGAESDAFPEERWLRPQKMQPHGSTGW